MLFGAGAAEGSCIVTTGCFPSTVAVVAVERLIRDWWLGLVVAAAGGNSWLHVLWGLAAAVCMWCRSG